MIVFKPFLASARRRKLAVEWADVISIWRWKFEFESADAIWIMSSDESK